MEFNRAYSRSEFLSFLRINFLPEDFQQNIEPLDKPVQFQYTREVTKLGECNTLDLIVYEVRHIVCGIRHKQIKQICNPRSRVH